MNIFEWLGDRQILWLYFLILAMFLGLANRTGKAGNDACMSYVNRGRKTRARLTIFVVLITGVLVVTLTQGLGGAFLDAVLAAKVYEATGDISAPLVQSNMTLLKWIGVVLVVISVFIIAIYSGASQVVGSIVDKE